MKDLIIAIVVMLVIYPAYLWAGFTLDMETGLFWTAYLICCGIISAVLS